MNSLRFPETPLHYETEAARLTNEITLWEEWARRHGAEDGFQLWLDGDFAGQALEDGDGNVIRSRQSRLAGRVAKSSVWNREELAAELSSSTHET